MQELNQQGDTLEINLSKGGFTYLWIDKEFSKGQPKLTYLNCCKSGFAIVFPLLPIFQIIAR